MRKTKGNVASATSKNDRRQQPRSGMKPVKVQSKHRSKRTPKSAAVPQKPITKRDQLAGLLVRDKGATIEEMRKATGWLPHTVRATLTGLKKQGYAIDSDKVDGVRTYRAVVPR